MTALRLDGDRFSVVTIGDGGARPWEAMLRWPGAGDVDLPYAAADRSSRDRWATRLDQAVVAAEQRVLLVASGAGCFATAWWARLSPSGYVSRVAGALFFSPLEQRPAGEGVLRGLASPGIALPFPSAVVGRAADVAGVDALARSWGGTVDEAPATRAGSTAWDQAQAMLMRLTARVVDRDLRRGAVLRLTAR